MRLGFVLISNVYNEGRKEIVSKTFPSLAKTNTVGLEKPVLQFTYKRSGIFENDSYINSWKTSFDVMVDEDFPGIYGLNALVCVSAAKLLHETNCTHVGFLFDDFLYNPEWVQQLSGLIERHPNAIAWSIYRSSYTRYHRIVGGDNIDVLMTMHDGVGTMSRQEWEVYGVNEHTNFECDGGNTIDIHHAFIRKGERWATSKDYMQNLGIHAFLGRLDQAIDFVGEV